VSATVVEEAEQILSAGFGYVTEKNVIMLFRRHKILKIELINA
jgi:hypothetical protein